MRRERKTKPFRLTDVYFVVDDDRVKIGYSNNPQRRLYELQLQYRNNDLWLLGSFLMPPEMEGDLHKRFDHLAHGGEWFQLDRELMGFIDGLHAAGVLIEYQGQEEIYPRGPYEREAA